MLRGKSKEALWDRDRKKQKMSLKKIRSAQRVKYYEGREAKDFKTISVDVDELCQLLMNWADDRHLG